MQQLPQGAATAGAAGAAAGMPVEASQRAVIRSLATQVADLQRRLEQAAGDWEQPPPAAASAPTDARQLVGMLVLLRQQLAGLERIQQQLEAAPGSPSLSGMASDSSPGGASSAAAYLSGRAHAAALLGTELPALQATVGVMECEVRRMAAAVAAAAADAEQRCTDQGEALVCMGLLAFVVTVAACMHALSMCAVHAQRLPIWDDALSAGGVLRLPAPAAAPAAGDVAQAKEKWKARCKDLRAQLAAATSAAQHTEASLRAKLEAAECASAEQAAQQAGTVQSLQARVEELATAGAQLEAVLQDTAQQLTEAAGAAEALQAQLHRQQKEHREALQQTEGRLAATQVTFDCCR